MKIAFDNYVIKFHEIDNKHDYDNLLKSYDNHKIFKLTDEKGESFIVINILTNLAESEGIVLCLTYNKIMGNPYFTYIPGKNIITIGVDYEVIGFDLLSLSKCFHIYLDSIFYRFYFLQESDMLLIIHELGIIQIALDGSIKTKVDTTVITDFKIRNKELLLTLDDDSSKTIQL